MSKRNFVIFALILVLVVLNSSLYLINKHVGKAIRRTLVIQFLNYCEPVHFADLYLNHLSAHREYFGQDNYELALAIDDGDIAKARKLAASGINLNVSGKTSGIPFLLWAVFRDYRFAEILLENGYDPNQIIKVDKSFWKRGSYGFFRYQDKVKSELLKLDGMSIIGACEHYREYFKRLDATLSTEFHHVIKKLLQKKTNLSLGYITPLTIAVAAGDHDETLFLIEHGANVNELYMYPDGFYHSSFQNGNKSRTQPPECTPLLVAVERWDFDMALLLIEHGAKCDLSTIAGRDVQRLIYDYNRCQREERKDKVSFLYDELTNVTYKDAIVFPRAPKHNYDENDEKACKSLMKALTRQGVFFDAHAPFESEDESKNCRSSIINDESRQHSKSEKEKLREILGEDFYNVDLKDLKLKGISKNPPN